MFDMSWGEIMVIGGVALIVIGPKDLPKALRTVGQMTTKVRRLAGEFQTQFSEAMREAELQDVQKEMEGLKRDVASATSSGFNPIQTIRDEIKGSVERPVGSSHTDPAFDTLPDPIPPVDVPRDDTYTPLPEPPVPVSEANGSDAPRHDVPDAVTPVADYINPEVQPPLADIPVPVTPHGVPASGEAKR